MPPPVRPILTFLALIELGIGTVALFAPVWFYTQFPPGRGWLERAGLYDEHLITDVGELTLALGVILLLAAIVFERRLVQVALAGYLVQGVPHLVYHAIHRDNMTSADNAASLAMLGAGVILSAAALWLSTRRRIPATSRAHRRASPELR
ncbi:MAG: hypothetical protein J2P38_01715 [Candidatus Dormibacteraeota bacterium]|nr:hypothetical protein [Candidatus Dormibacteraeota bacterium]